MSSMKQPPVVANLDLDPVGAARPGEESGAGTGAEPDAAGLAPQAPPPISVNSRARGLVTRSVASNVVKPVERAVVRPRATLPAPVSMPRPRVRRFPAAPSRPPADAPGPAPEPDVSSGSEQPISGLVRSGFVPDVAMPLIARLDAAARPSPPPDRRPPPVPATRPGQGA